MKERRWRKGQQRETEQEKRNTDPYGAIRFLEIWESHLM